MYEEVKIFPAGDKKTAIEVCVYVSKVKVKYCYTLSLGLKRDSPLSFLLWMFIFNRKIAYDVKFTTKVSDLKYDIGGLV